MNLIIVESPTKARTLSRFLGKEYGVEATMGHIKDLPKSKLGVDVEKDFAPKYLILKSKGKSIKKIKDQSKKAKVVYLATDPDREGEAIAKHVVEVLRSNDQLKRIVFHEITKTAVEKAINNPRDVDENLVDAQIARRVLDRLVGYKLSPLLWKKVRRGLSAGRVQSVAVRLIVEREREIKAFVPEEYWEIFCEVTKLPKLQTSKTPNLITKLIKIDDKRAEIKNKDKADKTVADLKKATYKVSEVKKREVSKNPSPPFTTSTMTQSAARTFFWSTRRTMSIAQKLYEEGLITYHRTDSVHLSKQAVAKVRQYIKSKFESNYLPPNARIYKTRSKVAQEAHEAIRPTKVDITKDKFELRNGLNSDNKRLYDLIWKRFVACQMASSVFDETTVFVEAKTASTLFLLRASGQVMKFDGWKAVYEKTPKLPASPAGRQSSKISNGETQLPEVRKDEPLRLIKVDPQQKFTEPPARYGEASLVRTLEKLGIGRPSTYAPIITTIQLRNYVEKIDGKFNPTPVGIAVNDFLISNFPKVFDYQFTAEMEDDLDNIAHGKRKWAMMMKDFYSPFEKKLESVEEKAKRVQIETEKLGKKCPKCKSGELVVRIGRFGKFISCSRFPECDHTDKYLEKIDMKCLECKKGEVIVKKTKKGRRFYGCSRFPKCKWASWRKPKDSKSVSQ